MTGPTDSIIGIQKDVALKKFLTHMPHRFKVASGPALLCGVMIEVDERTGRGLAIERVQLSDTV
jgi:calcineurin-like phosphoesterase